MKIMVCNACGKQKYIGSNSFNEDYTNDFDVTYNFGYSSEYDGQALHLNLCDKCFNKFVKELVGKCKYTPII